MHASLGTDGHIVEKRRVDIKTWVCSGSYITLLKLTASVPGLTMHMCSAPSLTKSLTPSLYMCNEEVWVCYNALHTHLVRNACWSMAVDDSLLSSMEGLYG